MNSKTVIAASACSLNLRRSSSSHASVAENLAAWELLYVIERKDGTLAIAERLAREIPNIRILYEAKPRSLGRAFRRGFAAVSRANDYVTRMDADLNHQP